MKNNYREHPEYLLLYLFSILFLISFIESLKVLAFIGGGSMVYYLLNFRDFKFYKLIYPVAPFMILMLLPSIINYLFTRNIVIPEFTSMIILKVGLSAIILGNVVKKYSSLYLVEGILNLGFPAVLNRILALTFRYFYMIHGDVIVGQNALYSRGLRNRGIIDSFKIWGEWIGGFFLKSSDHSEKVYHAMKARGFTGESRGSFLGRKDLCLRLLIILVVSTIMLKIL